MASAPQPRETLALIAPAAGAPVEVAAIEVAPPGPGEVRVRMLASGICHTDLMVAAGQWWSDHPYVLGHEGVGRVEDVGPGAPEALLGRTVLLAWRAPCSSCRYCARGDERLCVDLAWAPGRATLRDGRTATPSLRLGTHAGYAVVAAGQAIPVPDDLDPVALCTIGCAVMTGVGAVLNTAAVRAGDRVAVIGCGGVGASVIQGARIAGASRIIAVDLRDDKLAMARRFGATHTARLEPGGDAAEIIRELSDGHGVDHAFDAVGTEAVVRAAIAACDVGGSAIIIGTPSREARLEMPISDLFFKRLSVRTSQYGDADPPVDVPRLVHHYRDGALSLDELITAEVELRGAPAAIAALEAGDALRSVIRLEWSESATTNSVSSSGT